jgi:hypothetical protein
MPPLKLFLDHWAIVDLLEDPSFAAQRERLESLCKSGVCVLVLTIWYVHEALRDGNKDRARGLCAKIEALSKQVPSLWIKLRTQLQEDEVADEFFRSIGAKYQKRNPFCEEAVAIFPNHEKLSDIERARRDGLLWFLSKPELFGEALREQKKYPAVKTELKAAVQATVGRKGLLNEARKQYVEKLLPSQSPGGLVIADESKREFLQQMDITKFRALSFEAGLSEATTADAQARPTEQDLVDLQHAVSVVPYVDVAVLDGKFCKYALTVKKNWKGAKPLAECFDSIDAALDWIEKEASKH